MNQIALQDRTDELYDRVRHLVPEMEWETFVEDIRAIEALKRERNAVILAHNYQTPEIFHCVADIRGDSLALAREAQETEADVIVMAGVHFMAETAKMLNPHSTVLIPDMHAGCSLADSITARDVRMLREKHPGVPVVSYVNTSAEVKAETDVCCTSGNAKRVVESLGTDRIIMIPDEYLARNIEAETGIKMITWPGHCEVHERFTPEEIARMRADNPGLIVIAHPECPPEVVAASDFSGSTAMMGDFVRAHAGSRILLVTECSMSDNLAVKYPQTSFVRPCNMCPHMKRITLSNIRQALENMTHEVTLDPELASRGRRAVERMLAI
ncbi:quinolinate synthase NadA [Komagataeibacter kakiaceti JCM 25156]